MLIFTRSITTVYSQCDHLFIYGRTELYIVPTTEYCDAQMPAMLTLFSLSSDSFFWLAFPALLLIFPRILVLW